ncbi:MAG: dihydroorotate dehydrogenase electron transfer subunit [Planctomycetota bacterium]|jgi:dihydroorotate dehydrogenase electron transfer subunit
MVDTDLPDKGIFRAIVVSNTPLKTGFRRLCLRLAGEGARCFSKTRPGQFAEIKLSEFGLPGPNGIRAKLADIAHKQILLRRPFSFCDVRTVSPSEVIVEILYCVLGPGTLRMSALVKGNMISIIGPLGNRFSVPAGKKIALLVAGGMGAPPLLHLARYLKSDFPSVQVAAFAGARTVGDLPFTEQGSDENGGATSEFAGYCAHSHVATDDGSAGFKGFVTEHLQQWLKDNAPSAEEAVIYSCGPEVMLAEVAKVAAEYDIDCQVSMERMMGCGIGLCQSCAVESKSAGADDTVYKLCCKDGPVFDAREVVFEQG